jgi:hypothetical protein
MALDRDAIRSPDMRNLARAALGPATSICFARKHQGQSIKAKASKQSIKAKRPQASCGH